MTYETAESSVDNGRPYFLYLLDNGIDPQRLTSDPKNLTKTVDVDPEEWVASPLIHSVIEQGGNIEKSSVSLSLPISDAYGRTLLNPAYESTVVTIWRGHHSDVDEEHRVVWRGRVVGAKSARQVIEIVVESIFTSMRRTGCRARYMRTCRHVLYKPGCNLNIDDWKIAAEAVAISGLQITVTEAALQPNGYYLGGVLIHNGRWGWIQRHIGTALTLVSPLEELETDILDDGTASVEIAPGCDLSHDTCIEKFQNWLNFGGMPYMPDLNPFSISIV